MMGHFMSSAESDLCHLVTFHPKYNKSKIIQFLVLLHSFVPFSLGANKKHSQLLHTPCTCLLSLVSGVSLCGQRIKVRAGSALRQSPSATELVTVQCWWAASHGAMHGTQ